MAAYPQDIVFHDQETTDDCMQCVVASILRLPKHEVPNFCTNKDDGAFWRDLTDFIHLHRLHPVWVTYGPSYRLFYSYYIVTGKSPRSTAEKYKGHATIYYDDALAHDPHLSRAGLLEAKEVMLFTPWHPKLEDISSAI